MRDSRIGEIGFTVANGGGLPWRLRFLRAVTMRVDSFVSWAKQSEDADQVRRLLALAVVHEGGRGATVPGLAGSVCRPFETGFCGSMLLARTAW